SERYITDRFLPDKAIDVIDEAGARARLAAQAPPPEVAGLKSDLEKVNVEKDAAVRDQNFERAASLRDRERELQGDIRRKQEESGTLTKAVRRKPYSVILLDEIEKAHPDVFNILLQVLDEGHLTDNYGRVIDFKNTVVIMTSNVGARDLTKGAALGFASGDAKNNWERMAEKVREELKNVFNPEFLNRLDETIVFHPLTREH